MKSVLLLILFLFISPPCLRAESKEKFAEALKVRGEVAVQLPGQKSRAKLAEKMILPEGAELVSEEASAAQIKLLDGSLISLGPASTLMLNRSKAGTNLLHLALGKVRATVTKGSQKGEKLIITTKSAALGVRGTDFWVIYDRQSGQSSVITLEGTVAMAKWAGGGEPEAALAEHPQLVAGGKYLSLLGIVAAAEPTFPGAASGLAPGIGGGGAGGGRAAAGPAAGKSAAGASADFAATMQAASAVPAEPKKIPSYFLETLKKEENAVPAVSGQGDISVTKTSPQ